MMLIIYLWFINIINADIKLVFIVIYFLHTMISPHTSTTMLIKIKSPLQSSIIYAHAHTTFNFCYKKKFF